MAAQTTNPELFRFEETHGRPQAYDLVVIGAGVAGLNALYAATHYLRKGARVLLLDQKVAAGGMWNITYDYARLHQPHPMFTVGDLKWNWRKSADYLAARDEVQKHLASSLAIIGEKITLNTEFEKTVSTCREIRTDCGFKAEVTYHANSEPDARRTILTDRAIYAAGFDYRMAEPLPLSSNAVISIAPGNLNASLVANPDAPVYVVGGGKTGMDTVLAILDEDPGRKISIVNGRGTNFLDRTKFLPTGLRRWTSGRLLSRISHDLASYFNGDNEDETIARFRAVYSTDPKSSNDVFLYGLQSEDEHARIRRGVSEIIPDYLTDVTDCINSPQLALRNGKHQIIETGSIFVNCTGSFLRNERTLRTPCLSPHDTILTISPRDGFHFLSSVAGFFLTHLLWRDDLRDTGFYTFDHTSLFQKNRNAWVGAAMAQAYMNQTIAVQVLPITLLNRCGIDYDRWYPFPRRLLGLLKMKANAQRDITKCRKTLDRIAERFEVRCSPLM